LQVAAYKRTSGAVVTLAALFAAQPTVAQTHCMSSKLGRTVYTDCSRGGGGFAEGFTSSFNAAASAAAIRAARKDAIRAEGERQRAGREASREDRLATCIYSGHTAAECAAFEKEVQRAANWEVLESEARLAAVKARYLELQSEVRALRHAMKGARSEARCWWRCDTPDVAIAKTKYEAIRKEHDALMVPYQAAEREWKLTMIAHRNLVAQR